MCSVQTSSWSSSVEERVLVGGERCTERCVWGSHTHHFIFTLFYIMHGRLRICQPCKGKKNQVKQRCSTLSLTSVRYSLAPGIHFTAKHRPYSLQIEWAASKWNEVERPGALIKNTSGGRVSPAVFAQNICWDVIITTASHGESGSPWLHMGEGGEKGCRWFYVMDRCQQEAAETWKSSWRECFSLE